MKAELLLDARARLGECPVWDATLGCIWWVDIDASKLHRTGWPGGADRVELLTGTPGSLALSSDGGLLAAAGDSIWEHSVEHGLQLRVSHPMSEGQRWNDGKADPRGRFVVGTTSRSEVPATGCAALWCIEGGCSRLLLDDLTISNGLAWSHDGSSLFYIDTPTQRIDEFDYDLAVGATSRRRTFAEVDADLGAPDGLALDADGGIWVALWGGGCVIRLMDGKIDARIDIGHPYPTCPAFVGDRLDHLLITSASRGGAGDHAGGVFVADVGIAGALVPLVSWESVAGG